MRAFARWAEALCLLSAIACGVTLALNQFLALGLFRGVLILIALMATIAVGGSRMIWRVCSKDRISGSLGDAMPVMIVGAGEAGAYAVNVCNKNPRKMGKPVILVDDAKNKQGLRIQNVPVRGTTKDIPNWFPATDSRNHRRDSVAGHGQTHAENP